MRRRDLAANPGLPFWDHRKSESGHEHALFEQEVAHLNGLGCFAEDDRDDRRFALEWFEASGKELFAEIPGVLVERCHAFGVAPQVPHRAECAAGDRAGQGVGEQLRSGPLGQVIGERGRRGGESSGAAAEGFAES